MFSFSCFSFPNRKILLNFMQMVSLVASMPLRWTPSIEKMFEAMATISSAGEWASCFHFFPLHIHYSFLTFLHVFVILCLKGTSLLIPDCEFSHVKTSDVFYMKQVFFTFAIPLIFVCSCSCWSVFYCVCKKRWKSTWTSIKNRMILSITLMIFLCYPMLVRICLSMLKCLKVGDHRYLMSDLEEPCFAGRHSTYTVLLTVPQIILLTMIPMLVYLLLHKNKKHLDAPHFRVRYGLLYRGYVKDREWWEVTVAFRKVTAVAIGTFF